MTHFMHLWPFLYICILLLIDCMPVCLNWIANKEIASETTRQRERDLLKNYAIQAIAPIIGARDNFLLP